jgi:PAS domain S-box-containing protein
MLIVCNMVCRVHLNYDVLQQVRWIMLQYTPYVFLSLISMIVSIWLAFTIWAKRPGAGIIPFVFMAIGLTLWSFGNFAQLSLTPLSAKIVFIHTTYLGITIVPAAWMLFCLAYTGRENWLTRRKLLFLGIEPVLVQIAILTNPIHQLFWQEFAIEEVSGIIVTTSLAGNLFWVHATYSYILLVIGCAVLIRTMIRSPQLYRGQITLLLVGAFAPWIANIVFLAGLSPLPPYIDLTPLAFVVTVMTTGWSMYRFRLLDLVPIARDVIVENMDDAILVLDTALRIVDANASALKLLQRPLDKMLGQHIPQVLSNQDKLLDKLNETGNLEVEIELPIQSTVRHFKLQVSTINNQHQEASGHIVVLHDISSLKEVNQALELANEKTLEATRLKSEFLATMSHELRTPLNAIIGYTELQLAGMVGELSEVQQQYQERVFSNANHLLELINDILDLSKVEAGRMELIREPFDLHSWVDQMVQQNRILADEKGLDFITHIDDDMPQNIMGDSGRLRQIVINLLSNAFKFTHEGQVKLTVKRKSESIWTIIVEDSGIGIPPHKQETIFDEFHQVDNSSTRQYSGTGLGLAIVRKLALAMGGNVRLSSTVGEGSQFSVILPLEIEQTPVNDLQTV